MERVLELQASLGRIGRLIMVADSGPSSIADRFHPIQLNQYLKGLSHAK